jgi:sugar O-acyltransferase (sialic acid O-acetyltransferase NeuD family)
MKDVKRVIIFGTGAVAAEITSQLEDSSWGEKSGIQIKGYVASDDAGLSHWKEYKYPSPYLGNFFDYKIEDEDYFVLALGNYQVKRKIVDEIKRRNGKFTTLIHPTAIVAKTATIGEGNILDPFTIIGPNVKLGDFNLLTSQSIISHDSVIGSYNFFATSLLCGYNCIGDDNYFGIRATTLPEISIGNRNLIQAGMIVDKDITDDTTVFHRFKEKIIAVPKES